MSSKTVAGGLNHKGVRKDNWNVIGTSLRSCFRERFPKLQTRVL